MTETRTAIGFAAPGRPILVEVGVPEATAAVRALFPSSGEASPSAPPDLVLRVDGEAYRLDVPGGTWSAPDLGSLLTHLEMWVAEALVRRSPGLPLHAGGVVTRDGALLLVGPSGSGKSTLTAGLAARGCAVLGDDVVLLGSDGAVGPLRRRLKVEEPARSLLDLPPPTGPLHAMWPHAAFYVPEDLGSRWAERTPVRYVALPRRTGGDAVTDEVAPAEALGEVLGHVLLLERISAEAFEAVVSALAEARCFRLDYGEPPAAVDALTRALS